MYHPRDVDMSTDVLAWVRYEHFRDKDFPFVRDVVEDWRIHPDDMYEHAGSGELHLGNHLHRVHCFDDVYSFVRIKKGGPASLTDALKDEFLVCPACLFGVYLNEVVRDVVSLTLGMSA
jgi:hypothetical protein